MSRFRRALTGVAVAADLVFAGGSARAAEIADWLTVRGLLDVRLALTDQTVGWEQGGLGKTRYGAERSGDGRIVGRFAEGSLIAESRFGWDLSGYLHLVASDEQRFAVDVAEAFVTYKPAPVGTISIAARAGAMFPPISLENTGLAWTSPYTITPSAINSWVGEELKSIGPEATVAWRDGDFRLALSGSAYTGNDPAGTELAWRGWALHDRKAGVFERLPLAAIKIIRPTSTPRINQAPYNEPGDEIDDRLGYYVAVHAESAAIGRAYVLHYDNRADDTAIKKGQWAWRTRFTAAGAAATFGEIDTVAQVMTGTTSIITRPPAPAVVKAAYRSGFVLVSRAFGRHRVSARAEYFDARDRDRSPDNNAESGTAWTLAYVVRPAERQRLTLELLHVYSKRPERTASFGLPAAANETQLQASYRFFF